MARGIFYGKCPDCWKPIAVISTRKVPAPANGAGIVEADAVTLGCECGYRGREMVMWE